MSNFEAHTEYRPEPFIWTIRVDCSNSVNHDRVQMLFLVGIEHAPPSRWFYSEAFSNQMPDPLYHVSLPDNSEWILGLKNLMTSSTHVIPLSTARTHGTVDEEFCWNILWSKIIWRLLVQYQLEVRITRKFQVLEVHKFWNY